jgi:hypothetical protein
MKAMLDPRIVAARIQGPDLAETAVARLGVMPLFVIPDSNLEFGIWNAIRFIGAACLRDVREPWLRTVTTQKR